jgi:hypothetical protein
MLTKEQIKALPKGTYTNNALLALFGSQQGKGRSAYYNAMVGWQCDAFKLEQSYNQEKPDLK